MTKYELLYGVTVEHFPNEKENVQEKLRLARERYMEVYQMKYSFEQQEILHELGEAIRWCEKILKDIDE